MAVDRVAALAAMVGLASLVALAGCATRAPGPPIEQPAAAAPTVVAPPPTSPVDLPAPDPAATRTMQAFPGTGRLIGAAPPATNAGAGVTGEIQLQFTDTEIATVVASVIGDGLGAPYVIDPSVKGTMTLRSSRALSVDELVPALEAALQPMGFAVTPINGTYHVVPIKDAPRSVHGIRGPDARGPGYGVQVVPLKFVAAADMQKVLEPLAPAGGILRVDEGRNLLILAGTGREIASMLDVVETFDVDWLAGMSFALYTVEYVDAKTLTAELSEVFADPRSPLAGVVRFVPIARLNAILVITPQPKYLADVETWIRRLDLGGTSPGRRIYVYDVQNTKAGDLAKSLNRILSLSGDGQDDREAGRGGVDASTAGPGALPGAARGAPTFSARAAPLPTLTREPTTALTAERETAIDTGGVRIVPNDENNSLLILASPSEFSAIDAALKRLDLPPRQVLIEATLAEVTLTDELRYGVQWAYQSNSGPIVLSESASGGVAQRFPGFSYLYNTATDIRAVLNAIESVTRVNVLSNPKLMVLNNREAQLQIGDQVPVAVQSAVNVGNPDAPIVNSVEFRDTGVILHVTPRVNQNGLVQLDITQEVSDVVRTTTSGIDSPTIQQRRITSTVAVRSGETVALGGLIREGKSVTKSGVPLLGRIPVLGALFRTTDTQKDRTELIVLITPRVVRDDQELREMMDRLRQDFRRLPQMTTPPAK
jgi:general secretion pathway protein D